MGDRVWLSMASSYPYVALFRQVYDNLRCTPTPGTEVNV